MKLQFQLDFSAYSGAHPFQIAALSFQEMTVIYLLGGAIIISFSKTVSPQVPVLSNRKYYASPQAEILESSNFRLPTEMFIECLLCS